MENYICTKKTPIFIMVKDKKFNYTLNTGLTMKPHQRMLLKTFLKNRDDSYLKKLIRGRIFTLDKETKDLMIKRELDFYDQVLNDGHEFYLNPLIAKSNVVEGRYYAHEYNKTLRATGQVYYYLDGYKEIEIDILDKNYCVMDGFWELEDDEYFNSIPSGTGDYFYPERGFEKVEYFLETK